MSKWTQLWQAVKEQLAQYNFLAHGEEGNAMRDEQDGGVMDVSLSNTMDTGIVVKLSGGFDFEVVAYNAEVLWHSGTLEYAGFIETDESGNFTVRYVHGFATDIVECIKAVEAVTGEGRHEDWWAPNTNFG